MAKRKRRRSKGKLLKIGGKTYKCRLKKGRVACKLHCKVRRRRKKK